MNIGIPKEIKDHEYRVSLTPAGVDALTRKGNKVYVEKGAGEESGFTDQAYFSAGAYLVEETSTVWNTADLVLKVKEPQPEEFVYFRENLIIFTYLHLAAELKLTKALLQSGVISIAYETIQQSDGSLPLLQPMSEIAGRMSVQIGARLLERVNGGKGMLLSGIPGVPPAHVVILGSGVVGSNAAAMAIGLGARTTVLDINVNRLKALDDQYRNRIETVVSSPAEIEQRVPTADLFISGVLLPGKKSPCLVQEDVVRTMRDGAVIVDVGVDQGSVVETMDHATTHSHPTYIKHGVVHYGVANIPGAVPHTSTMGLSNATLPYVMEVAATGIETLVTKKTNTALAKGFNTIRGHLVHAGAAEAHGLQYTPMNELF